MPQFRFLSDASVSDRLSGSRNLLVVLVGLTAAGCASPLALQHPYFADPRASVARLEAETRAELTYYRALQLTRRACAPGAATDASSPGGPNPGAEAARRELAAHCAASSPRPAAWHGGTETAYRRWIEDRVLELPDSSRAAASSGGP